MTIDVFTHQLSGKDWPTVLNVMRGDLIRVTGTSESNGITMTLSISGGRGSQSSSDRNWAIQWDTNDARASHTLRLLSRTGQNEEIQLAETKVVVYDKPPVAFEYVPDSNLFINQYIIQTQVTSMPKSVEWIVDDKSRGVESIVDGKVSFPLNQLLPGGHRVVGRTKFQDNQGSVDFANFRVDIPNTLETKVDPAGQLIDLTTNRDLKSIIIRVNPLVTIPDKARLILTVNGVEQELQKNRAELVFETVTLGPMNYVIGASIVDNGMRRESNPLIFSVTRDLTVEAVRSFTKIQAVPTKRIERYLDNTKTERDVNKMLALSTAVLKEVELAISSCNDIVLPGYLLREHQVTLLDYQAIIRDTLSISRRFLVNELKWWQLLSASSKEIQGQVNLLLAARQVPEHPYDVIQRNLNSLFAAESDERSAIRLLLKIV